MAYSSSLLLLLSIPFLFSAFSLLPTAAGELPQPSPVTPPVATYPDLLAPILSNLGYQELAVAFSSPIFSSPWFNPVTLFAPSDDYIRSCGSSCSPFRLVQDHLIPGAFSAHSLSNLTSGTKLKTFSSNRCLTVTFTSGSDGRFNSTLKIFVEGIEITRPDLFNDGKIVIHGIQGFFPPLLPFSCISSSSPSAIASLRLRDAIALLGRRGYSILALAIGIESPGLVGLNNMTVFALDDLSIFRGGQAYVAEVRFHVVPNQLLMHSDLVRLSEGALLPTLEKGKHLVVTQSGESGPFGSGLRINYVPIKVPDVLYNSKIVVHSLFFPFPQLYSAAEPAEMALESSAAAGNGGGVLITFLIITLLSFMRC